MGAVASGGARVINSSVVQSLEIPDTMIDQVAATESQELARREQTYREGRPAPHVAGQTVILVDDGIATGATMRAAVAALKQMGATYIVVATPTVSLSTLREMRSEVDDFIAVMTPVDFRGVGEWYEDFSQTSDEEVRHLLAGHAPSLT